MITDFDFIAYIRSHHMWSFHTFGLGDRTKGILKHIGKELEEIEENPSDALEWCDVIILAIDGALRNGIGPEEICAALELKQRINGRRTWDGKTDPDQPTEHVKKGSGK